MVLCRTYMDNFEVPCSYSTVGASDIRALEKIDTQAPLNALGQTERQASVGVIFCVFRSPVLRSCIANSRPYMEVISLLYEHPVHRHAW